MKTKSHKKNILQAIKQTKNEMCKALRLSEESYDIMRYELAFAWLQYNEFYEGTARIMVLSRSFFNWWYQQINGCERIFLDYKVASMPENQRKESFFEFVISMEIRPSSPVYQNIRIEGYMALQKNPQLKNLKIYNDDKTRTKSSDSQGNKAA